MFWRCRWLHLFNVTHFGVYQCSRCKTVSIGAWRALLAEHTGGGR